MTQSNTGRKLSAMILPGRTLVQVDALKVYEEPKTKNATDI
jgi:hypothetical protein